MGSINQERPRLVKCVFSSRRFLVEALSKARKLRVIPAYKDVYIRKSMTPDERKKESELRAQARELNQKEHNESWLSSKISDSELSADLPYSVLRKDRSTRKGGGVCALIHSLVQYEKVSFNYQDMISDVMCFDILLPTRHRFILVYRPPNSVNAQDETLLSVIFDLAAAVPFGTTVLGDFNLDIDWHNYTGGSPSAERFLSIFDALSLHQFVDFPTRQERILDIVLSPLDSITQIHPLPPLSSSDHNIVVFSLAHKQQKEATIMLRDFHHMDKDAVANHLRSINWMSVFSNYVSMDDIYARFCNVIHNAIESYVPVKHITVQKRDYPRHIMNLIKQRERIFNSSLNPTKSVDFFEVSRKLDYHLKRFLAYKVKKLAERGNLKYLAAYAKTFLKQGPVMHILEGLNGEKYITDEDKSEALADYFESVFVPDSGDYPSLPPITNKCFEFPIVTPQTVCKLLRSLRPGFSLTSDGLPQFFFKVFAEELSEPLTHMYNISLLLGQVPSIWKHAIITPIPKAKDSKLISSFRPISILPTPLKILEKIVKNCLLAWVLKLQCIPLEQHGFLPGSSTCTQLIDCTHSWIEALNSGQ
ncbi:hypothetical protein COOONC_16403, partial [Cooperia oncophora]